jgi:hypothetical protein
MAESELVMEAEKEQKVTKLEQVLQTAKRIRCVRGRTPTSGNERRALRMRSDFHPAQMEILRSFEIDRGHLTGTES